MEEAAQVPGLEHLNKAFGWAARDPSEIVNIATIILRNEDYCASYTLTYGAKSSDESITYGSYSDSMVVDEHFVVQIPNGLPLDAAAPLL
ncbi:hypothetical protein PIB30_088659, partial [Stylosanthes scabra]|nr:hypothetical protein [Stylosanthes scabra]